MLTRVAILGAVDIAADLVKHNVSIHNIDYWTECGAENDGSPDLLTADHRGEGKDHGGDGVACNNSSAESLDSVLSLVRLDYALLQFFRFLSANQCEGDDATMSPGWLPQGWDTLVKGVAERQHWRGRRRRALSCGRWRRDFGNCADSRVRLSHRTVV